MNKINMKDQMIYFRNGLAFSFSWLVICVMALSEIKGNEGVKVSLLINLLELCAWAAASFVACFMNNRLQKKPFMFRLNLFYVLFVPVEVMLFQRMHLFGESNSQMSWMIFGGIVVILYVSCVLLEFLVFRKEGVRYTDMLEKYNQKIEK